MDKTMITIEALVAGPPEKVWRLYTDPEHITGWNFASDDWCCPSADNDLRVGGLYRARMEAKDGSFGFDFEATYDEVKEPELLSYTIADGRPVTTRFEATDGATKVTTTFEAEGQNPAEMQRAGWQAILNNFKRYAEQS